VEPETITFADAAAFDAWLADNHERSEGIWIKVAKKGSGIQSVTEDDCVDVGLCWGWISSLRHRLDDRYYLQKYTPRRPKSRWSKVNVHKVAKLTEAGRIQPPGQAEIDAAKADGRWDAAS
jgi:uncharacterized protein YdeI (YjbR/CyaY-like superfamily)